LTFRDAFNEVHFFEVFVDFVNFLQYTFVEKVKIVFKSIKVMKNIFREQRHNIREFMQVMLASNRLNIAIDTEQLLLAALWLHTVMILLSAFAICADGKMAF
jgi:hypothetical protein